MFNWRSSNKPEHYVIPVLIHNYRELKDKTNIIGMPSDICHRRIMSFPDKFTDPPVEGNHKHANSKLMHKHNR